MGKPVRIQLSRKKGWRMPENTVSVARPSQWGNPVHIGAQGWVDVGKHRYRGSFVVTPAVAVEIFRDYIAGQIRKYPDLLASLRGKNLACWCKPGTTCHADVLLRLANDD